MHKDLMEISNDIHKFIILEMTLKTLERDRKHITVLKMHHALDAWYDLKINQVFKELKAARDYLYKKGCKVEKKKSDEFFTEYYILFRGVEETRNYANLALRNWVSEEMKRLLGMEYRTPADGV
ncbi:hypothetical protein ACTHOQ_13840 [Solibacillus silvestris]|uniref:hypothetical protein n=1 Tax=Solibacillus silvestris TaxID=76853 RepID=UPI003F7E5DFF